MATTDITCATEGCDHTIRVEGRNRRAADYRAKKLVERGWTCRDCSNAASTASALAKAEESGLPTLEGSEKQVAWAVTLREVRLLDIDLCVKQARGIARRHREGLQAQETFVNDTNRMARAFVLLGDEAVDRAIEAMRVETDARFWIDGRMEELDAVIAGVAKRLAEEDRALSPAGKAEAADEQDAMAEATLRPAEPASETVAEVAFRDRRIVARYDERSDRFNEVVKRFGFGWDAAARAWVRTFHPAMMGDPAHRLAETAHELLAAGIVVAVHDPEARALAAARSYEPEHRRWVSLVQAGEHAGKFRLTWGRDEDLYQAFRTLPGAAYRDKLCLVPATSRDAVLDFAELHGFRLTAGATARAAEVLAERERGTVVEAVARPKPEPVEAKRRGDRPDRLDVPDDVTVDDELVDHD